jgi:hypothetical protein
MVVAPAATPVTTPVIEPTVTITDVLFHVPPGTASENVVEAPVQTVDAPVMGPGAEVTVIIFVA